MKCGLPSLPPSLGRYEIGGGVSSQVARRPDADGRAAAAGRMDLFMSERQRWMGPIGQTGAVGQTQIVGPAKQDPNSGGVIFESAHLASLPAAFSRLAFPSLAIRAPISQPSGGKKAHSRSLSISLIVGWTTHSLARTTQLMTDS